MLICDACGHDLDELVPICTDCEPGDVEIKTVSRLAACVVCKLERQCGLVRRGGLDCSAPPIGHPGSAGLPGVEADE
jgi:hypothetical protein